MIEIIKKRFKYIILILVIIFLDQATKRILISNIDKLIDKSFFIFKLAYVENYGAAFNIFTGNRIFLTLVSIVCSIILIYLTLFRNGFNKIERIGLSLILSGSIGNGIDRILNGFVVDFINLNFIKFPIFNIADISINLGFLILMISIFNIKKK